MKARIKEVSTLLFDWDGTLIDSAQLGLQAFQKSFALLGIEFNQEVYEATYSPNWYSMYEAMGVPREKWERADKLWIEQYGEQTSRLVTGARETLSELQRKGYRLGLVTSGNDCRVSRELTQTELGPLFQAVVCNEQMVKKKPDPEGLDTALRLLDEVRERACYVGDSPEDIAMGKNACVLTVGVRSTYPTSWRLQGANPDLYLESISELTAHF
ncbi:MAG TPA: HAD-IA family hydrolase [Pyrinomonadaceae bacterium]|nr:HAD-IA family hydrolase [Pyrinomonadaceae bacterium]